MKKQTTFKILTLLLTMTIIFMGAFSLTSANRPVAKAEETFPEFAQGDIYLSANSGVDTNDGTTVENAVKTLTKAVDLANVSGKIFVLDYAFSATDVVTQNITLVVEDKSLPTGELKINKGESSYPILTVYSKDYCKYTYQISDTTVTNAITTITKKFILPTDIILSENKYITFSMENATKSNITYNLYSGTNADGNPSEYVEGVGVPSFSSPTKRGFTFDGFYANAEHSGEKITAMTATVSGAVILCAKWIPNPISCDETTISGNAKVGVLFSGKCPEGLVKDGTIASYELIVGNLPSGLTMDNSGNITGTPSKATTENFTITMIASNGASLNKEFTMTVAKGIPVVLPTVTATNLTYGDNMPIITGTASIGNANIPGSISFDEGQKLLAGTKNYNWTFTPTDTTNYEVVKGEISLNVKKAIIETSGIVFNDVTSTYDNTKKTITASNLPTGVTVSYNGSKDWGLGGNDNNSMTNAGKLIVTANFTATDSQNYELSTNSKIAILLINKRKVGITIQDKTSIYNKIEVIIDQSGYTVTSGSFLASDTKLTLSKVAGVNVGRYSITGVYSDANYDITYKNGTYTISPKNINVSIDNKTSVYGDMDVGLTYTKNGIIGDDTLDIILTRQSGATVGDYIIYGTNKSANYNVTFDGGKYTITKKNATVTINGKTSIYGDVLSNLDYTITGGLVSSDNLGITLTKAVGKNVDEYAITATSSNGNYNVTFTNGKYTISARNATIIISDIVSVYGDPLKKLEYSMENVMAYDHVEVVLTKAGTAIVGVYDISAVATNSNYSFSYKRKGTTNESTAKYTIQQRNATVTIKNITNIYGSVEKTLLYSQSNVMANDNLNVSLTRASGNNVGEYAISGTYNNTNYIVTFARESDSGKYTITPKKATVTAKDIHAVYGEGKKALSYDISGVLATDSFTVATSCDIGNGVAKNYVITIGDITGTAVGNYEFTKVNGNYTIAKKKITVTVFDMLATYGNDLIEPTTNIQDMLVNSDSVVLTFELANIKNVGTYDITAPTYQSENYDISFILGKYKIAQRSVTVTLDKLSAVYGSDIATQTYTVSNLASGETNDILNISFVGVPTKGMNVGNYAILASINNANYKATIIGSIYNITPMSINVTILDKTSVYGDAITALTATTDSGVDINILNLVFTMNGINFGEYDITATNGNSNYEVAFTKGKYTISQRPITIAIDNKTSIYGEDFNELTATIKNLVNNDDIKCLLSVANKANNVGKYIIVGEINNNNYIATFTNGEYSVTPRPITVKVHPNGISSVYGDALAAFIPTVGNLPYSETIDSLLLDIKKAAGKNVGTYAITAVSANENYTVTFECGSYTITSKPITITISDITSAYGEIIPVATPAIVGLIDGDELGLVIKYPTRGVAVGNYDLTATIDNLNYTANITNGKYTVSAKEINVTIDNKTSVYGDPFVPFTATTEDGIEISTLGITFAKAVGKDVGNYAITAIYTNSNYSITFEVGSYEITKRYITITADNKKVIYGDIKAILTANLSQVLIGDTIALNFAVVNATGSNYAVGEYEILLTIDETNSTSLKNYGVTLVNGKYTVTTRKITVTLDDKTANYGLTDDIALTYSAENVIEGDELLLIITRRSGTNVGNYPITATSTNVNYDIKFINGVYEITPKEITVTINSITKQYGDVLAELKYTTDGTVGTDDLLIALTKEGGRNVGKYVITGVCGNRNYKVAFTNGEYTIDAREISVKIFNATSVYGSPIVSPTVDLTQVLSFNGVADDIKLLITKAEGLIVGTYALSATYDNSNYDITFVSDNGEGIAANYTIMAKSITIDINNITVEYGEEKLAPTADFSQFVNGDYGKLSAVFDIANYTKNVGTYAISLALANVGTDDILKNYAITMVNGEYEITQRKITIVFENYIDLIYNGTAQNATVKFDRVMEGDELSATIAYNATPLNAGDYIVTVTVGNGNYVIDGNNTLNYSIARATYDMSEFIFENMTKTYNGDIWSLTWSGTLPNGVTANILENNSLTNVGELNVIIEFTIEDDTNYNTISSVTKKLTINKATYDMSNFMLESKAIVYDGKAHLLTWTGLPEGVTLNTVSNNSITNVGKNNVVLTFNIADNENYNAVADRTATIEVTPKLVSVVWGTSLFTYNGVIQKPTATVNTNINGETVLLNVVLMGDTDGISAITHKVKAVMTVANNNYALDNETKNYTIDRLTVSVAKPVFDGVLKYGDELPSIKTATVGGYAQLISGQKLLAGNREYDWEFIIEDTINYTFINTTGKISLVVEKFVVTVSAPTYSGGELTFGDAIPDISTTTVGGRAIIKAGQSLIVGDNYYIWNFIAEDNANYDYQNATGTILLHVEPKRFTINFYSNGGTAIETISGIVMDTLVSIPPENPTKAGYEFIGWYIGSEMDISFDFTMIVEDNMDLYAKWKLLPVVATRSLQKAGFNKILLTAVFERVEGLTYTVQWYKEIDGKDVLIEGATADTLLLYGYEDSGNYSVLVAVSDGVDTIDDVMLSVADGDIVIGKKPIPALAWVFGCLIVFAGAATFVLLLIRYSKEQEKGLDSGDDDEFEKAE